MAYGSRNSAIKGDGGMITSPCLDCTKRHALCHTDCKLYKAFRVKLDNIAIAKLDKNKQADDVLMRSRAITMRKNNRGVVRYI